jgi:hypothetical protein
VINDQFRGENNLEETRQAQDMMMFMNTRVNQSVNFILRVPLLQNPRPKKRLKKREDGA